MSNIFSAKRFGNYFLWDLKSFQSRASLSVLVVSILPLTFFILEVFIKIFSGEFHQLNNFNWVCLVAAIAVLIIAMPNKLYGHLTDRKAGASWLMVPASTFEKWLSMILIVGIIMPVIFGVIFFGLDALLAWIFPATYGTSLIGGTMGIGNVFSMISTNLSSSEVDINISPVTTAILNWLEYILIFTLGAIYFKKSKAAKTILCLILAGMILSSLSVPSLAHWEEGMQYTDPASFINTVITVCYCIYAVVIVALGAGIWFRLKTLKH